MTIWNCGYCGDNVYLNVKGSERMIETKAPTVCESCDSPELLQDEEGDYICKKCHKLAKLITVDHRCVKVEWACPKCKRVFFEFKGYESPPVKSVGCNFTPEDFEEMTYKIGPDGKVIPINRPRRHFYV